MAVLVGAGSFLTGDIDQMAAPAIGTIALGIIGYIVILVALGAGSLAMITQPIIAHYVTTLSAQNIAAVATIAQREADSGADADGFADALDIGGAV